jgi:hypothetical protein
MSGTSMAAPHVAGGVALIWSAAPGLKNDQDATAALLNGSAEKLTSIVEGCGGNYTSGPNNSWGNGLLDLHSAYDSATFTLGVNLQGTGTGVVSSTPMGIYCPGDCSQGFGSGVEVTLRAAPGDYSIFSGWPGTCTGAVCEVTMDMDREVAAVFNVDMPHSTRINLPAQADYPSLAAAYGAASSGAVISAWGITFNEDLVCGDDKAITLKGGYDQNYFANGGYTSIHGKVELRRGSMTVERMIIL